MRAAALLALVAWLCGCSCEGTETPHDPPPTLASPAPASLPTAARTDLPAALPAITVTVTDEDFVVSNRAFVASWPAAEREAIGRTRPLGDADFPIVERSVDDAATSLVVPALGEAMQAVAAIERARAAITHGEVTTAFAIRARPDVHFGRVLSALYAAGLVGFAEPRLMLASASGERELRLTLPTLEDEGPDPALGRAIALAMAAASGAPPPPDVDSGVPPRIPRISVVLGASGLTVRRGLVRFAPGCVELTTAIDASAPTIPTASITPGAIEACLTELDTSRGIVFSAPADARYGDAVAILEALAADAQVSIATTEPLSPR